ncbi:hypothetical protein ACQ4LE_010665 [Meloidogyne hapla]
MSNSFFVFLESNTTDYPDNQPNKFRVHLPKPLYFSGNWVCGVHSISYPFSWPSTIGTLDEQWMKIHFIDDNSKKNVLRVPVPAASHNSVEALKNYLATTLKHQSDAIGSVERPGAFIAPPSLLRSPPRAEKKIKRSAKESKSPPPYEELRSPPPYLEEEQEKKEKSPSPELGSPPLYIEDENKDRTPSPTREEPTSPPPYLEEKSPEKPSTPPIEIVETSPPKPKKERKEEKEKQAQENVTQKAPTSVLSNVGVDKKEEKKEQENTTQKSTNVLSTIGLAKKEEKKDEQKTTQKPPSGVLSSIGLDKKDEKKDQDKSQKPTTILSTIGVEKKKEDKKEQDKTPQKPTSVLSTIGVEKKEDKKEVDSIELVNSIELHYLKDLARFKALLKHKNVLSLSFSPQLGYVLGFSDPNNVYNNEIAKYGCDLRGGFSSFAIYSKGLTENMIVGNSLSSLLRVVSISGAVPGEYNEKIYDSPIYARVLPREINEIEVELRTMDNGRLVPFAFGTVHIVLIFKKVINF